MDSAHGSSAVGERRETLSSSIVFATPTKHASVAIFPAALSERTRSRRDVTRIPAAWQLVRSVS